MRKILDHVRGYSSPRDRNIAIAALRRMGFNYFVKYVDTQSRFALYFGTAKWVREGDIYID